MRVFLTVGCGLLGSMLMAMPPQITGLTVAQRVGTRIVDMAYDLSGDTPFCAVSVTISTNNGASYDLPAASCMGDGYGAFVVPGVGKAIAWNAANDWANHYATQIWVQVRALASSTNPLEFTEMTSIYMDPEQGEVWCQPVYDGTCIVASAEKEGAFVTVRKYDTNLVPVGGYAIVASTNDTAGLALADHKHIFQNGCHYLVFSIAGSGDGGNLYLTKFDRDFNRLGITQVVTNEPPTNDMLLFGDGTFIYVGKFAPESQAAHKIYKYDQALNLVDVFLEGTGSNAHANADTAIYLDERFYFVSPQYVGPNVNERYYRIAYDTNFNVILPRETILYETNKLGTVNGLAYYNGRFIVHYCKGSNEANPIARAVYDAGSWQLLQNEVVFTGSYHASHTIIIGDTLYLGCTYETGGTPAFSNKLSKFIINDPRLFSFSATAVAYAGPLALDTRVAPWEPTNLVASDGLFKDKVRLSWSASEGAVAYEVWRNTAFASSAATCIAMAVTATEFDDATVGVGPAYYYWVKAVGLSGTSGFSTCDIGFLQEGPIVKANGVVGCLSVSAGTPVTVAAAMNAGDYTGIPADWWVVAVPHSGSSWYYLNNSFVWVPFAAGNLGLCRPVYQGVVADVPTTSVLDNFILLRGSYSFYFAVDQLDGVLNYPQGPILYDAVQVNVE